MPDTSYLYGSINRGSSGRGSRRPSRRPSRAIWIVAGLLVLTLGVGGSAYAVMTHRDNRPTTHSTASAHASGPLVQPPVAAQRGACLDRSGSVDRDDDLGNRTSAALQKAVAHRDLGSSPAPRTVPVAPVPEQRLVVRLVRANSFTTDDADRYSVDTTIPGVPGLRSGEPYDDGSDDYTDRLSAWDTAYAAVSTARVAAAKEQADAAKELGTLAGRDSNGSDVLGCVAAVLASMDPAQPRDVLLVSDLADRGPGVASYPDSMKGAFAGAQITVVQACPSGVASVCAKRLAAFEKAVGSFGIDPVDVHTLRAEVVTTAVQDWLTGEATG